jgi:hypothetical protein
MPGASFHSFYWQGDGGGQQQGSIGSSASGGYVPWQTSIIISLVLLLCL